MHHEVEGTVATIIELARDFQKEKCMGEGTNG